MVNFWLLTDTHFGHDQVMESCQRPLGFEELILGRVRQTVRPSDVLIFLGDFCFYQNTEWHQRFMLVCQGKRWLVRGNHDKKTMGWYLSHGWDFVADEIKLDIYGKSVVLSHRPVQDRADFDLNIHGHHHNTLHHPEDITTDKHRLIFLEHHYTPINLRKVVENSKC